MRKMLLLLTCLAWIDGSAWQKPPAPPATQYVPVREYDASRNAAQDLQAAQAEAARTGKRVLMQVGGSGAWCDWCHFMDTFFQTHPTLVELRDRYFVTVRISVSVENQNREVLSHYPKIFGYPHFFVLDEQGRLLHSQQTSQLEMGQGDTYNPQKMEAFLREWGMQRNASGKKQPDKAAPPGNGLSR